MALAYLAMVLGYFLPAFRARVKAGAKIRSSRPVPMAIEALWVGTQALVVSALLASFLYPDVVAQMPLSLMGLVPSVMIGAGLFLAGCATASWAASHLAEELTIEVSTREGGKLATSGPYARVRHPIYTGIFLQVAGLAVALASPLVALYLAATLYAGLYRAKAEEELLSEDPIHGAAYRGYMQNTGRFLPRSRRRETDESSPDPR